MPAKLLRIVALITFSCSCLAQQLTPHPFHLAKGRSITLSLPANFNINIAAQGLHCPRFMAISPDHRIFIADLYDRSDNTRGAIDILEGWNPATHTFAKVTPYLQHLRNPNNLAFYTEPAHDGKPAQWWIYIPLTDKLIRYRYNPGDNAPTGPPEVLATYPDYGLNYKYGGWHLTRTIAFAPLHGQTRLYVTVGSSCNACREKEEIRATLSVMDPDGKNQQILAHGLRNAVDIKFIPSIDDGALFATNMGADHLGDQQPEDTFFELDSNAHPVASGANYGWPTCYFDHSKPHADPLISAPKPTDHLFPPPPPGPPPVQFDCSKIPPVYTTFAPHSSPLGLAYFDDASHALADTFLVALHGPSHPHIGTGYRVVRFTPNDRHPHPFIMGFVTGRTVKGRPCGILNMGPDSFLLTDDLDGIVYFISAR